MSRERRRRRRRRRSYICHEVGCHRSGGVAAFSRIGGVGELAAPGCGDAGPHSVIEARGLV